MIYSGSGSSSQGSIGTWAVNGPNGAQASNPLVKGLLSAMFNDNWPNAQGILVDPYQRTGIGPDGYINPGLPLTNDARDETLTYSGALRYGFVTQSFSTGLYSGTIVDQPITFADSEGITVAYTNNVWEEWYQQTGKPYYMYFPIMYIEVSGSVELEKLGLPLPGCWLAGSIDDMVSKLPHDFMTNPVCPFRFMTQSDVSFDELTALVFYAYLPRNMIDFVGPLLLSNPGSNPFQDVSDAVYVYSYVFENSPLAFPIFNMFAGVLGTDVNVVNGSSIPARTNKQIAAMRSLPYSSLGLQPPALSSSTAVVIGFNGQDATVFQVPFPDYCDFEASPKVRAVLIFTRETLTLLFRLNTLSPVVISQVLLYLMNGSRTIIPFSWSLLASSAGLNTPLMSALSAGTAPFDYNRYEPRLQPQVPEPTTSTYYNVLDWGPTGVLDYPTDFTWLFTDDWSGPVTDVIRQLRLLTPAYFPANARLNDFYFYVTIPS